MAYVTVPKDLTRVKSKIVFGLTKRQLICFGGALLVGVPLYFLLRGRVTGSAAALIMVFAMLPGFLLALYERHWPARTQRQNRSEERRVGKECRL